MRRQLSDLRRRMEQENIQFYLIMTDDFHGSEYVGDYFKCREYVSGFSGSAGTLLAGPEETCLWTDGRYFLQAETQLAGSGITLCCSGQPGVLTLEEYLDKFLQKGQTLAFDGRCVMAGFGETLRTIAKSKGVNVRSDVDLVDDVWQDRPFLSREPVWILKECYAGESRKDKTERIREILKEKKVDRFLLSSLEDICWLLNVRGGDVECTPVVLSYLLFGREEILWYVQTEAISDSVRAEIEGDGITILPYEQIYEDIGKLPADSWILYDKNHVNDALVHRFPETITAVDEMNPTQMLKAVKNPTEVENERRAHIKDGVAVVRWLFWLKNRADFDRVTEMEAAERLEAFRAEQGGYIGPSFAPILASGVHGAIVHYSADEQSNVLLEPQGFLLADTGGHYLEGTTDITRTIAMGPLTQKQKELYTTVLRGHIALARAVFLRGAAGVSLDVLARTPLWEKGYDYNHGTGHGVGYLLSVHEGPNSFRYRPAMSRGNDCSLEEGMITSDEPGVYLAGEFGIRLENLLVCVKRLENDFGTFLGFEPLTMVPFDRDAILTESLTNEELDWINAYHREVYRKISPHLNEEERQWLAEAAGELG